MSSSSSRIVELANIIQTNTQAVDGYLASKGLPAPSFAADNPPTLLFGHGAEIEASRQAVVDATDELQALMLGPTGTLSSLFHNSLLSIQAILRFNLLEFPDGKEEVTFAELAATCGQNESEIRRLLRHAMAYRIFTEPRKGYVAHTAASKKLADPLMKAWLGFATEELCPSAVNTVNALQKWPDAQEPNHTGFNLANNTEEVFFAEIPKDLVRESRYADAMAWFNSAPGFGPEGLVNAIPWSGYETVVDVGGNTGLASQAIARKHESVKLIVQDRPEPVAEGRAKLDPELKDRVTFMEHDFFQDQTVRADVYLLRWILHDWSDKYAIKILRALIPALKRGARVVLNEFVLPPPGAASAYQSKVLRTMDLSMLELHNGKERDADDWEKLFSDCDPRFKFLGTTRVPGSRLGVVEAKWEP
ncbi:putative O-methyltransferase [Melanomma pulvis-pyrius CBS 109.77]|uniref:Putative O-methyltransferase n=1 Tax=Melanomma pulvis-pyrius CBS 109.77 TaxID=1314802 RepID=A0A6A6X5D6_9PLEO|nr:putative O-methyltransferase [Melanomma pulvis-pyrius CBS 109.77]